MPSTPEDVAERHGVPVYQGHPGNVADEYRPTPEQIEMSRSTYDLGDFVDKLNDRLPHFRAVISVEYRYGLPAYEKRELTWARQNGKDAVLIAGLDVLTTGNIPGRPEFGPLAHRLRGVVLDEHAPYGVGEIVAGLARANGLTVTTNTVDDIPF